MTIVKKGINAFLFKDGDKIGTVQEVKITYQRDIEQYFSINSRTPPNTKKGKLLVSGSIKKAWIDSNLFALVCGNSPLKDFTLKLELEGTCEVFVYNCLFVKGSISVPQDGFLNEILDFIGSPEADYLSIDLYDIMTMKEEQLFPPPVIFWMFDYTFSDIGDLGGYIILG